MQLIRVLTALTLITAAAGCEKSSSISEVYKPHCALFDEKQRLAEFVIECARAANPMAGDESENLVAQCEQTGNRVVCPEAKRCKETTGYRSFPCA